MQESNTGITINSSNLSRFVKRLKKALKLQHIDFPTHTVQDIAAQSLGKENHHELLKTLDKPSSPLITADMEWFSEGQSPVAAVTAEMESGTPLPYFMTATTENNEPLYIKPVDFPEPLKAVQDKLTQTQNILNANENKGFNTQFKAALVEEIALRIGMSMGRPGWSIGAKEIEEAIERALAQEKNHLSVARTQKGQLSFQLEQAQELVDYFGGDTETEVQVGYSKKGHSGEGLYAWDSDYPEDGAMFLGKLP